MYLAPSYCPVCGNALAVTRLSCPACDTTLEGRFSFSRLEQLAPEQRDFVELFVRCEGKLNRVQDDLGLSYPTVRGRLDDVIRALGYEVPDGRVASSESARREILERLARHEISSEEALILLQAQG